ncbi:MAG: tyrosine-type recombinase/integrase [Acidobacteriota bacterium]
MEPLPELDFHSFLADVMRDYLDYLDHLGFSIVTQAYNLRRIDRFLLEQKVDRLEQLDVPLLMRLVDEYKGRVRANTLRLWRDTFHGLCRYLVRLGWKADNPVSAFPIPHRQPYRPYVFSPHELRLLFDCLKGRARQAPNPVIFYRALSYYSLYHLLYACGLRVSEALRLTPSDFSCQEATLYIRPSKFGKDRLLPIGPKVCSNLSNLLSVRQRLFGVPPEGVVFLFLPERRPYNRRAVSAYFRKLLQRLGIYRSEVYEQGYCYGTPHLHELRRAFAVHRLLRWYRQHVDVDAKLPLLATYMGHGFFGHTKTYLTLTQQLLAEAHERFASRFDRLDWVKHDPQLE